MIRMGLGEARSVLGAAPGRGGDDEVRFRGVSTDSRRDCTGTLFFALRGPNFDGHDHVDAAARAGAVAAVTETPSDTGLPRLVVKDSRRALGRLAADWRGRFDVPFVAVTGSNGKTTVKEMIASILRRRHRTLSTAGNLNTDIGLSGTLFGLGSEHRRAVVEMGANHPGEIADLARLCGPRVGVVTQCAPAHLEGFGDVAGVARAKGELFEALPADGIGVVNADDRFAGFWAEQLGGRETLRFGLESPADVSAEFTPGKLGSRLTLATPRGEAVVELALPRPAQRHERPRRDRREPRDRRAPPGDPGGARGDAAGAGASLRAPAPRRLGPGRRHLQRQPGVAPGRARRAR